MKLEKVTIDGVVYYKEIVEDDTPIRQEERQEEQEDIFRRFRKRVECGFQKACIFMKAKGEVAKGKIKEGWEKLFHAPDDEENILLLLPYMDEESKSEVFRELIKSAKGLKEGSLERILPYFNKEERDALILHAVEQLGEKNICAIAKYASEECLSHLVDGFIDGRYPSLDIESAYPYLSKTDIKRLFDYFVTKKQM